MTLWTVRNGYIGTGQVAALVEAETLQEAKRRGIDALRAVEMASQYPGGPRPDYWQVNSIEKVSLPYVGDQMP